MYLCYGSTAIKNIVTLTVRGPTLVVVYRCQILTPKVGPRAVRVNNPHSASRVCKQ